jgi:hypothetical protein
MLMHLLVTTTCVAIASKASSPAALDDPFSDFEAVQGQSLMQASTTRGSIIGTSPHLTEDPLDDLEDPFGDVAATKGQSLLSTRATISTAGFFTQEDTFGVLEDSFEVLAVPQKVPVESYFSPSAFHTVAFWIISCCSQDFFVLAFVGFTVPFLAEKLLRALSSRKKAHAPQFADRSKPPHRPATVNLGQLMHAVRSGDEAQWRASLQAIPNSAHAADSFGCTALHVAADVGIVEMARVLLDAGANADVKDTWEETPLHFAAREGNCEICEILLAKKADIDALNSDDVTPLVMAAKTGNESVCQLLLDRGATCRGLPDADVPPLLLSLLMHKLILPSTDQQEEAAKA